MFKISTISLLLFAGMIFSYSGCKKNSPGDPLSQLPPLTTKGLNTFGCLVNGKVLVPEELLTDLGPPYACSYVYSYPGTSTPFGFLVGGTDKSSPCDWTSVTIDLDSVDLKSGDSLALTDWRDSTRAFLGKKYGSCMIVTACPGWTDYYTTNTVSGEATIVFMDPVNQIASGTFWFDAINVPGDTVHVREGRFDMHYTN